MPDMRSSRSRSSLAAVFSFQGRAAADTFSDTGFATETVASFPPYSLVGMAWAPDGRLFIWEKNGVVRVIKNGQLLPTPFIDLSTQVNTFDDRGFWGLAFDPNFAQNGYVYMSYMYENAGDPNSNGARTSRLERVTASGDVAVPGSETVILGSIGTPPCSQYAQDADCISADSGSHTMGSLHFASDGTLFIGVGDGADAAFADSLSLRGLRLHVVRADRVADRRELQRYDRRRVDELPLPDPRRRFVGQPERLLEHR